MARTVLITGSSRGIGRTTAGLFAQRGWNVAATMRSPRDGSRFDGAANVLVTRLDVEDVASIREGVRCALERFGGIDVLVNNAGYGVFGALETISSETMRRQFQVNTFGMFETTKAVLPHFRERRAGLVVNLSSIAGKTPFPLGSVYNASKFAVEGFSEALRFELEQIGAQVKMIEPGVIATDALGSSLDMNDGAGLPEYEHIYSRLADAFARAAGFASSPSGVAETIYQAATDGTDTFRYVVGADAEALLERRRTSDDASFTAWLKALYEL